MVFKIIKGLSDFCVWVKKIYGRNNEVVIRQGLQGFHCTNLFALKNAQGQDLKVLPKKISLIRMVGL